MKYNLKILIIINNKYNNKNYTIRLPLPLN